MSLLLGPTASQNTGVGFLWGKTEVCHNLKQRKSFELNHIKSGPVTVTLSMCM